LKEIQFSELIDENNSLFSDKSILIVIIHLFLEVIQVGFTKKQEENIRKMPYIETKIEKSKDKKYIIHKTTITHVRPVGYYQAVLNDKEQKEIEAVDASDKQQIEEEQIEVETLSS
jgi:hypothetical protein